MSTKQVLLIIIVYHSVYTSLLFNASVWRRSFPEWSGLRNTLGLQEELTHNGRSELQQSEETHALPLNAVAAPPAQVNNNCKMLLARMSGIRYMMIYYSCRIFKKW